MAGALYTSPSSANFENASPSVVFEIEIISPFLPYVLPPNKGIFFVKGSRNTSVIGPYGRPSIVVRTPSGGELDIELDNLHNVMDSTGGMDLSGDGFFSNLPSGTNEGFFIPISVISVSNVIPDSGTIITYPKVYCVN